MKNHRELISRRIHILTGQAAGARQAGTRVDLIEAQIDGWTHVLRMFDAGVIATTPRVLTITDYDVMRETNSLKAGDPAHETWVRQKLVEAGFNLNLPFVAYRNGPEDAEPSTTYKQAPLCAS